MKTVAVVNNESGNGFDRLHEGVEFMNPLKWPIWLRIPIVVTIL